MSVRMGRRILRMISREKGNFFSEKGMPDRQVHSTQKLRCFARPFTLGYGSSGYYLYTYSC